MKLLGINTLSIVAISAILLGTVLNSAPANAEEPVTHQLGGTATLAQPGLNGSVFSVKTTADMTNRGGHISFSNLKGKRFSSLHTLSTDFKVTEGDCSTQSPRFYVILDRPIFTADGFIFFDVSPDGTLCGNMEQNTGNMAEATDKVRVYGLPYATLTNTVARAQSQDRYGNYFIKEVGLVGDNIYAQPNGQTVLFDNVTVNNNFYDFEPADATPPIASITSPSDNSIIYGQLTVKGSVSDNYKLKSYNLVIKDDNGEVVAGPGTVDVSEPFTDAELFSFDTTTIEDGTYTIHLEASDVKGNKGVESFDVISVAVNNMPDSKEQCKNGGYTLFPANFKNQGLCTASVQAGNPNIADRALLFLNDLF